MHHARLELHLAVGLMHSERGTSSLLLLLEAPVLRGRSLLLHPRALRAHSWGYTTMLLLLRLEDLMLWGRSLLLLLEVRALHAHSWGYTTMLLLRLEDLVLWGRSLLLLLLLLLVLLMEVLALRRRNWGYTTMLLLLQACKNGLLLLRHFILWRAPESRAEQTEGSRRASGKHVT